MIRVNNIKVPLGFDFSNLKGICTGQLKIPEKSLISVKLSKKSVDARPGVSSINLRCLKSEACIFRHTRYTFLQNIGCLS